MAGEFILASGSPRRRQLLSEAGYSFSVISPDVDETPHPGERPLDYVRRIARAKVSAHRDSWKMTLAADTTIALSGTILAKPLDEDDAIRMLESLSDDAHQALTGWALGRGQGIVDEGVAITDVRFRPLSRAEIERYVGSGEPLDRAGAYAIQGGARGFVEQIDGSFTNVMGLPMEQITVALGRAGIEPTVLPDS